MSKPREGEAAGRFRRVTAALGRSLLLHGLARAGFVVKAALYGLVATLALRLALGREGAIIDVKGALSAITDGDRGFITVGLAAIGIGGLGVWFVVEALVNPRGGRGIIAGVSRIGLALGGAGYVGLAGVGVRLALGRGAGPSGDEIARTSVAESFAIPGGSVAVVLVGIAAIIVGTRQAWFGASRQFLGSVDLSATSALFRRVVAWIGGLGFVVQGMLFASVGLFLLQAVIEWDPAEATGPAGALEALAARPHGAALLAAAAIGLLAFALYAGIEAASHRFPARRAEAVRLGAGPEGAGTEHAATDDADTGDAVRGPTTGPDRLPRVPTLKDTEATTR